MILAIDVGNTNITIGAYEKRQAIFVSRIATERLKTEDQYAIELRQIFLLNNMEAKGFEGCIISSVVPGLSDIMNRAVGKIIGCEPFMVNPGIKTGLNIMIDNPSQLGSDLVAGAVAAINMYELPCVILDLGTATKISVIDEKGSFLGCTISPGIGISLEALSAETSQLPRISFDVPSSTIGTNTIDSMGAGIVFGTAAMLDGMTDRIEAEIGKPLESVIATGGYSEKIAKTLKREIIYNGNLVLDGLSIIYEKNK